MNRKLKALGLALVAVFAMAGVSAATASAEQWHAAEHGTVEAKNVGEEVFTFKAGTVKCAEAIYRGSRTSSTVSTQNAVPEYNGCTAFGFVNTKMDVGKGCEYRFNTPVNTTGTVDIVGCLEPIAVTAFNCWVTMSNQNGLSHLVWSNAAGSVPMDIHDTGTINNIVYTQHDKNFPKCSGGSGLFGGGIYEGTTTWRAFNTAGAQVDLTVT